MQHRIKMLYCMKYIKLIVQLSRHFCGDGEDFCMGVTQLLMNTVQVVLFQRLQR
jgi:hypothetical protein